MKHDLVDLSPGVCQVNVAPSVNCISNNSGYIPTKSASFDLQSSMLEGGRLGGAGFAAGQEAGQERQEWLLPVPPTPSLPSRMDTLIPSGGSASSSLWTGASSSGGIASMSLAQDPLMSYITQSQATPGGEASPPTGKSSACTRKHSMETWDSMETWELSYEDLNIVKIVGEGSFGRVYLAYWHDTPVAVKILTMGGAANTVDQARNTLALSSPVIRQLEDEAGLLASLRHPNVVNFYGVCRSPPCIVSEFCANGSLADLLAHARADPNVAAQLTWPRRLAMLLNAAVGIYYLHTRPAPIIHRDLKSANVLVSEGWKVKVTDFNLSRFLADTTQASSIAAMNPRWLAPEVMQGERATKASDTFAYGTMMWEMLTWQLPWGNGNPWQIVSLVIGGGRLEVPPRDQLPGVDTQSFAGLDAYAALMRRCWSQFPLDRPTFEAIIQELRALLRNTGDTSFDK